MAAIPVSEFGKALYYPYFGIRDGSWLKAALLYWDGIRRIGPGTGHHESYESHLTAQAGLLVETDPRPYVEGAADMFRNYVIPLIARAHGSDQAQRIQIEQITKEMKLTQPSEYYRLRTEKMTETLMADLHGRGLAQFSGEWVTAKTWVGGVYMMCLAMEMSEKIGAPPVTHVSSLADLGEYLTFGQPPQHEVEQPTAFLLNLGISFPNPLSLSDVPIEKVIQFHEKYGDERRRFRKALEKIAREANKVVDANAMFDYLSDQRQEIKAALDDHNKSISYLNIKSGTGLLKVSTPAGVGLLAAALNPAAANLLAGLGITTSLIAWWADRRSDIQKAKQAPYHYLLSVKKEFSG